MADEADLANDLVDVNVHWALQKFHQQLSEKSAGSAQAPLFCLDCETNIPEERRAWGFKYCVDCASERERARTNHYTNHYYEED